MIKSISILGILLTAGCASQNSYTGFHDAQSAWPTTANAHPHSLDQLPIYHGLPEKAYLILGTQPLADTPDAEQEMVALQAAKRHGGEAVLLLEHTHELAATLRQAQHHPAPPSHPLTYKDSNTGFVLEKKTEIAAEGDPTFNSGKLAVIIRWAR